MKTTGTDARHSFSGVILYFRSSGRKGAGVWQRSAAREDYWRHRLQWGADVPYEVVSVVAFWFIGQFV